MPSEEMHHGAQESARTEKPEFIVPDHVKGHIRETIKYPEHPAERSDTFNSPGVQPENPYNAFAPTVEALQAKVVEYENRITQLEALLSESGVRELADHQPRRVRHENGVTEQAVAYKDGDETTYEWEDAKKKLPIDDVTAGWNEFDRQRDAGMFNSIEPGTRVGDIPEQAEAETTVTTDVVETTEEQPVVEAALVAEQTEEEPHEEVKKGLELTTNAELISLEGRLERAVEDYAKLTAKNRGSHFGHFLHDSKLTKFGPLKWLADKANGFADKKITASREEYEQAITALQVAIGSALNEQYGEGEETAKAWTEKANKAAIDADLKLEMQILKERMETSKKTDAFVNWWVSHDSLGWKFAKAGMVAGAALPIGLVAGLGGAPILGLAAAGAGGVTLGNFINKRRANAVNRGDVLSRTDAQAKSQEDTVLKAQNYAAQEKASVEKGGVISASELTRLTEQRTAKEKADNRKRTAAITGAALVGAGIGTGIGSGIRSAIDGATAGVEAGGQDTGQSTSGGETATEQPPAPENPPIQGNEFTVQDGGSYTQELMDFANANGHALTPDQSWQLHQDLMNQFGGDYIDINGAGNDVYVEGGDFRLAEPGAGQWADGVGQYIQQWMTTRGLW